MLCIQFHFAQNATSNLSFGQISNQRFFISNHPYLLDADAKRRILLADNAVHQQQAQHQAFAAGILQGHLLSQA